MTYLESRGREEAIVHPSGLFVKQMNIASNHTTLDLSADALAEVEQKMLVLSSEHFAEGVSVLPSVVLFFFQSKWRRFSISWPRFRSQLR